MYFTQRSLHIHYTYIFLPQKEMGVASFQNILGSGWYSEVSSGPALPKTIFLLHLNLPLSVIICANNQLLMCLSGDAAFNFMQI